MRLCNTKDEAKYLRMLWCLRLDSVLRDSSVFTFLTISLDEFAPLPEPKYCTTLSRIILRWSFCLCIIRNFHVHMLHNRLNKKHFKCRKNIKQFHINSTQLAVQLGISSQRRFDFEAAQGERVSALGLYLRRLERQRWGSLRPGAWSTLRRTFWGNTLRDFRRAARVMMII